MEPKRKRLRKASQIASNIPTVPDKEEKPKFKGPITRSKDVTQSKPSLKDESSSDEDYSSDEQSSPSDHEPSSKYVPMYNNYNREKNYKAKKGEFDDFIADDEEVEYMESSSESDSDSSSSSSSDNPSSPESSPKVERSHRALLFHDSLKDIDQDPLSLLRSKTKYFTKTKQVQSPVSSAIALQRANLSSDEDEEEDDEDDFVVSDSRLDDKKRKKKMEQIELDETLETLLSEDNVFSAIATKDSTLLRKILKEKPESVNESDSTGMTPILAAASAGYTRGVEILLENKANEYHLDNAKLGILHYAAKGNAECLSLILKKIRKFTHFRDSFGAFPTHYAAEGNKECLAVLLDSPIKELVVDCVDFEGSTPLMYASTSGSEECVRYLINMGANVTLKDYQGATALHYAAAEGKLECIKALIEGKASPEAVDLKGWPPLLYADFGAKNEAIKTLLEANPNQLSILGDLVYDNVSKPIVMRTLKYIATVPSYYGILNNFIRTHIDFLSSKFSFLLKRKQLLDFDNKQKWFHKQKEYRPALSIEVNRDNIFRDSFNAIIDMPSSKLGGLSVMFKGEPGIGPGPRKEFFHIIAREILDRERGLFKMCANGVNYEPTTLEFSELDLDYYKFAGIITGLALIQQNLIQLRFTVPFMKQILGLPVLTDDLDKVDSELYKNMQLVLENPEGLDLTFSTYDEYNKQIVNLKPDGANIEVTNENKEEYVDLFTEWKLVTATKVRVERFTEGLSQVVDMEKLSLFNENELELLMAGLPTIDIADWKEHTKYSGFTQESAQVTWFWEVVSEMREEDRALLLKFTCGTSSVPVGGFQCLSYPFTVTKLYETDRLPSSATCFNTLKLPQYESLDELKSKLLIAIRFGNEGFTFSYLCVFLFYCYRVLVVPNKQVANSTILLWIYP